MPFSFLSSLFGRILHNPSYRKNSAQKTWSPEIYNENLDIQSVCVNSFGSSLFDTLMKDEGNLFFSPLSIHEALMMTANGASKETEAIFRNVLRLHDLPANQSVFSHFCCFFHIHSKLACFIPFIYYYWRISCKHSSTLQTCKLNLDQSAVSSLFRIHFGNRKFIRSNRSRS